MTETTPSRQPSAREDLYELKKAIDLYADEHALAWRPEVFLPKAGPGRTRWLRPIEIDRIYWAIRGRIWDHRTGTWQVETVADAEGSASALAAGEPVRCSPVPAQAARSSEEAMVAARGSRRIRISDRTQGVRRPYRSAGSRAMKRGPGSALATPGAQLAGHGIAAHA